MANKIVALLLVCLVVGNVEASSQKKVDSASTIATVNWVGNMATPMWHLHVHIAVQICPVFLVCILCQSFTFDYVQFHIKLNLVKRQILKDW